MSLSTYISLSKAITRLMAPLVEVAIHDISTNRIIHLSGSLSNRQIGDDSGLGKTNMTEIEQVIYPKINFNGKLIKSISVPLDNQWVMCINCDVSVFHQLQGLTRALIQTDEKSPFTNDWQEKVNESICTYIDQRNLSFDHLNRLQKKDIIAHLFDLEAFKEKNAADYVARALNMGRATVFNYLKELRTQ
jgi:predicted transcriptional regulator YheO